MPIHPIGMFAAFAILIAFAVFIVVRAPDRTSRLPPVEDVIKWAVIYGMLEHAAHEESTNAYKSRVANHRFRLLEAEANKQFGAAIAQAKIRAYADALASEFDRIGYALKLTGRDKCDLQFNQLFSNPS